MDGKEGENRRYTSNKRDTSHRAFENPEKHLKIAKGIVDRAGEEGAYGNVGNVYHSLGDYQKAIEYHEKDLKIAKEFSR